MSDFSPYLTSLRRQFLLRTGGDLIEIAVYALLFWVDWRIAMALYGFYVVNVVRRMAQ